MVKLVANIAIHKHHCHSPAPKTSHRKVEQRMQYHKHIIHIVVTARFTIRL